MRKSYSQDFPLKSKKLESSSCAGTHACKHLNICNKNSTFYPLTYCQKTIGLGCSSWQCPHNYIHGRPQITCRAMDLWKPWKKCWVILKSYSTSLPFSTMERNRGDPTHSPNLSWTISATCLPTFVLPVKDNRSILSSLAIAVLHNRRHTTMSNGKADCWKNCLHLPDKRTSTREIFQSQSHFFGNVRWLSRCQESCFLVRKEEQGCFPPPFQTIRASPVLILKFNLKWVVTLAEIVTFPKKICIPVAFF